ncbi:MAG TPA: hypothetical protein VKV95_23625 [Terriglobia bacterium]|nr:hypothetical protein [Terriglobia bacterium]
MRRLNIPGFILAVQIFIAVSASAQGGYKVDAVPLPSGGDVPAPLAAALQPEGARVVDSSGATVCEIWLGNSVPLAASANSSPDVMYGSLAVSTLVGAIHFPNKAADFRGQAIKPGFYTLRYGQTPQDGNHMGVNPTRDFLVMSPVGQDTNLSATYSLQDLVKMSKLASGTNHPAILEMDPAGSGAAASVTQNSLGYTVLSAQGQAKTAAGQAQPLNISIVVVGQAPPTE